MSYVVNIGYDTQASRYYVLSSDIPGLNVEANSVDELMEIARDLTPDLLGDRREGSSIVSFLNGLTVPKAAGRRTHGFVSTRKIRIRYRDQAICCAC